MSTHQQRVEERRRRQEYLTRSIRADIKAAAPAPAPAPTQAPTPRTSDQADIEKAVSAERERVLGLAKPYLKPTAFGELKRIAETNVTRDQAAAIEQAAGGRSAFMRKVYEIKDSENLTMQEALKECVKRHHGLHAALLEGRG
ncbi:MAG: hypothetical protein R6V12_15795 [Candidatus Hydrogenedentota bacterium]